MSSYGNSGPRLAELPKLTNASQQLFALAAGLLTITLFALTPTTTRMAIAQISGLDIGLVRTVGGGAMAIALIIVFRIRPPSGRVQWQFLALFCLGSFVLFPSLFSLGTQNTSAAHASLVMASMPLVTSSIGFMLDGRFPRPAWLCGAALALVGELVLILIMNGGLSVQATAFGDLVVLASCISFCVGAVAGSRLAARIGPWRPTFWAIGIASVALFPLAVTEIGNISRITLTPSTWVALIHLSAGASVLACITWSYALARGGIARVAPLQFAQPVLALAFAATLLKETVSLALLLCGGVILVGVVIAWRSASVAANGTNESTPGGQLKLGKTAGQLWWLRRSVTSMLLAVPLAVGVGGDVPALAEEQDVDVLLLLAADVSYSVNSEEYDLQRAGYIAALTSPPVLAAIAAGAYGRIGICYVEWSGEAAQEVVVDWMLIDSAEAARAFAGRVAASSRSFADRTSISAAIRFATDQFERAPYSSSKRIIDISGDGDNNAGPGVANARSYALERGITINGLVIPNNDPVAEEHTKPIGGLVEYFRSNVIGGPKSFVAVANDFGAFGEVLAQKLATEIGLWPPLSTVIATAVSAPPRR
jgi:drug/metabolite transporter (DMT)-like permease